MPLQLLAPSMASREQPLLDNSDLHQDDEEKQLLNNNRSPGGSDSEDEKRTNPTVAMDEEGNSQPDYQPDDYQNPEDDYETTDYATEYHAVDMVSLAETASDQMEDDLFDSASNPSEELAQRETRAVSWLRITVLTVMAMATVIVSSSLYYTRTKAQQQDFVDAFHDASTLLLDSFRSSWKLRSHAVGSLAIDLSSFADHVVSNNEMALSSSNVAPWPSLTFPEFATRAEATLDLADGSSLVLLPVVGDDDRTSWQEYAVGNTDWLGSVSSEDTAAFESSMKTERPQRHSRTLGTNDKMVGANTISDQIFNFDGPVKEGSGPFTPVWQTYPVTKDLPDWVNMDIMGAAPLAKGLKRSMQTQSVVLEQVVNLDSTSSNEPNPPAWKSLAKALRGEPADGYADEPFSPIFYPLLKTPNHGGKQSRVVVSVLMSMVYWRFFFDDVLQPSAKSLVVVVNNECGQSFSYEVSGKETKFLGNGDLHSISFSKMGKTINLVDDKAHAQAQSMLPLDKGYCQYHLSVYPTKDMRHSYVTSGPIVEVLVVFLVFGLACGVFFTYDLLVERRQKVVMDQAMQSTAIVSSLFPEAVRDRLFNHDGENGDGEGAHGRGSLTNSNRNSEETEDIGGPVTSANMFEPAAKTRLKSFLTDEDGDPGPSGFTNHKPIADLFPNCTVLFADISGFTAWSSLRDPAQVFTLLENIYSSFDQVARKRNVFKVETVGDSYVAVTGLPDPQEDHVVVMSKFARDCRNKMNEVTRKLELTLGPDTGDLRMRFGLHSGPVTAGVLRGERSRFQLFGDTVNTAARMESTGERDRIQCSQATADILIAEGKGHWLRARDKKVHAKGKGELQTYWIEIKGAPKDERRNSDHSQVSGDPLQDKSVIWGSEEEIPEAVTQRAKHQRLIDYNVDLLSHHLKRIVSRRNALRMAGRRCSQGGLPPVVHQPSTETEDTMPLDEVTEVIRLPQFDATGVKGYVDPDSIELPAAVTSQLKRYVSVIGAMYRQNPFHNFEHASHVVMSVNKLLQRVVAPSIDVKNSQDLHNYTYGITSDAIAQFAVVFAAMIHDVDHWGVSNNQLMQEGAPMAEKYNNKSIAEQNSVDLAWDLLMDADEYGDLQKCIFTTDAEYKRFRQIVVNLVMATDIFDKELGELRKNRWAKAFASDAEDDNDYENRKATVVIEHIMQASDVAHTMQHWHVYQKWNRRLFDELYTAWRAGRMGQDPSTFWYQGEMSFFDGYIIPLARKLKDCGVFGVASDECLNYAIDNRKEWEAKGQMIVSEIISDYEQRDREDALRAQKALEQEQNGPGHNGVRRKKKQFSRRRSLITTGG